MCHQCNSTGWVVAESKERKCLYGFRCACSSGHRYAQMIPVWNTSLKSKFVPDYDRPLTKDPEPVAKPKPVIKPEYSEEDLPF